MRLLHLLLFLLTTCVVAHDIPKTEKEIEVQKRLQAAAYNCAPSVAQFTANRKREFEQKLLAGQPRLPGYEELFTSYDNGAQSIQSDQISTSCTPVQRESHFQNNTCVLTPEVGEGPYYHKEGHPIRQNIAERQDGLILLLDIGVIDVNTCRPLPGALVDIWQANATGYYAGHSENPQDHSHDETAATEDHLLRTSWKEAFLRGAWPTDERGVAQFITIFPGYYPARASHIHTKVFTHWDVLPNGTYRAEKTAHVGQFFFDEEINQQIDKMYPYATNPIRYTVGRTHNWQDAHNFFGDSHSPGGEYSPIFKLELLGGVIGQGLIGYITMGINASAAYDN